MVYSAHAFLSISSMNKLKLSPEEAFDWLVSVATADGLITSSEKVILQKFADTYSLDSEEILANASQALLGVKPEVEVIDYRTKNGLLFENLIASFLKGKNRFQLLSWTGDKFTKGVYDPTNLDPDLHIQQIINGLAIEYYIECKWHHFWQKGENDYFYEIRAEQLRRYRAFSAKKRRKVLIAYAYGRTGNNPRGIYLIPLHAFHNNRITKAIADKKYRIEPNADAFATYMEKHFESILTRKS